MLFRSAATTFQPKHYHQSLVTLIPSISAFIGGDIVSGLYYLSTKDKTAPYLFLDLGTNAEIALVLKDRILCTSTAAGPAFEGTNISCGCAHIPGAIYSIEIKRPRNKYKTINNKIPVGVCGSGILSLYSELISKQLVDSFGMLSNEYFDTGFQITTTPSGSLTITQKDIRQIQLAIAAIKTGIDLLIQKSYLSINDIHHVYLSGSFGSSLDLTTLSNINLFPKDWIQKEKLIEPLGNSSLKGAISY